MMLSLRNTLRSVSLLVATIAFAPGCDDGQIDALGLSVEDIDGMSEQELDELAALEDLADPLDPADPHPGKDPDAHHRPVTVDGIGVPATHAHQRPETAPGLVNHTHPTHEHQRPETIPGLVNPVRPTHDAPSDQAVGDLANEIDDGCDTHADDPDLSNA